MTDPLATASLAAMLIQQGWQPDDLVPSSVLPDTGLILGCQRYPVAWALDLPAQQHTLATQSQLIDELVAAYPSLNYGIVRGQTLMRWQAGNLSTIDTLPSPSHVQQALGISDDLRCASVSAKAVPLTNAQRLALQAMLDQLVQPSNRSSVIMPSETGKISIISHLLAKLVHSSVAAIVYIVATSKLAATWHDQLKQQGITAGTWKGRQKLIISPMSELAANIQRISAQTVVIADLVSPSEAQTATLAKISAQRMLSIMQIPPRTHNSTVFGPVIYSLSLADSFAAARQTPPTGFQSIPMADLASVKAGLVRVLPNVAPSHAADSVTVINPSAVRPDGSLDHERFHTLSLAAVLRDNQLESIPKSALLQPNDLLINTVPQSDARIAIGTVPSDLPQPSMATGRIVVVRPHDPQQQQVLQQFLQSSVGQDYLRDEVTHTTSAAQRVERIQRQTIFLPQTSVEPDAPAVVVETAPSGLGDIARLSRNIEEVLASLKQWANQGLVDLDAQQRQTIGLELNHMSKSILPRSLDERVAQYPTPIAVAYQRFVESRFEPYKRMLCLRDLFESVAFFIYHVVLADAIHRLPKSHYKIPKDLNEAYKGFSTANRMKYVQAVLKIAAQNAGRDLFMPELLEPQIHENIKRLQSDFRNVFSHHITPSPKQAQKVIAEYEPLAIDILEKMSFLENYKLIRAESYTQRHGTLYGKIEHYIGPVSRIDELSDMTMIDDKHLVLVNPDGQYLCVYPFYQLLDVHVSYDAGQRIDSYVCFYKQRKKDEGYLEYETINGEFVVRDAAALDPFDALVARLK